MRLETLKWKRDCVTSQQPWERRINTWSKGSICSSHFSSSTRGFVNGEVSLRRIQTEWHAALWVIDLFSKLQTTAFTQMQHHKPLITLSLFPWEMFRWALHFLCHQFRPLQLWQTMLHPQSRIIHISSIFQMQGESSTDIIFLKTATLCNRLPHECFPEHYNFNYFRSITNR